MVMKRSHRVALKPTAEQAALFGQHAGYARFAYNWALGEWLTELTLRPRWNKVKDMIAPWGAQLSQDADTFPITDFGAAAEHWGEYRQKAKRGQRPGRRAGFPRCKRRKREQGFRADNGPDTVKVDDKMVILPKISGVTMVEQPRFSGSIGEVINNRTAGRGSMLCHLRMGRSSAVKKGQLSAGPRRRRTAMCSDGAKVENSEGLVQHSESVAALRRVDRPSPAVATSTARAIYSVGGSDCTPGVAGSTLG